MIKYQPGSKKWLMTLMSSCSYCPSSFVYGDIIVVSFCFTGFHRSYPEDVQCDASLFDPFISCWPAFGCYVVINSFFSNICARFS